MSRDSRTEPSAWALQFPTVLSAWLGPPRLRDESRVCPLVYGYIRSRERRPTYVSACHRALARYCTQENLRLCAVFVDQGQAESRPGLTGLCDVLSLPDSFAAVVVDQRHLSPVPEVAHRLVRRVHDTGARLLVVRDTSGASTVDVEAANLIPQWWQ